MLFMALKVELNGTRTYLVSSFVCVVFKETQKTNLEREFNLIGMDFLIIVKISEMIETVINIEGNSKLFSAF